MIRYHRLLLIGVGCAVLLALPGAQGPVAAPHGWAEPVFAREPLLQSATGTAAEAAIQAQDPTEAYVRTDTWETDPQALPPDAFLEPRGIAVDPFDGNVYVVDGGNRRIQVFTPVGTFVRSIGGPGPSPEGLGEPQDVAVQGSQIFVADTGNDRVAVFRLDGTYLGEWSDVDGPWGIAAAPDGRVFVVENEASRVSVFKADGELLDRWAGFGAGADRLNRPTGAVVAADGRLFVADTGNRRLISYDRSGTMQRESAPLAEGSEPLDLAIDSGGTLFVVRADSTIERRLDRTGLPPEGRAWSLVGARGIAAGPDSVLYATFQDDLLPMHGVQRWEGTPLTEAGRWGGVPAPLGRFDAPFRIASGERTLVSDSWRRLQELDSSGKATAQTPVGTINDAAVGPGTDLFVARDTELARVSRDGDTIWTWPIDAGSGYAWAVSLAYDPVADVIGALDLGSQRIHVLTGSGDEVASWPFEAGSGTSPLPLWDVSFSRSPRVLYTLNRRSDTIEVRDAGQGLVARTWQVPGGPIRLDADAGGSVYVLSRAGWAWKYDYQGQLMAVWPVGDSLDPRSRPTDIAVDDLGRVLVADQGLDRIEVYENDPSSEPHPIPSLDPACRGVGDKSADPVLLTLGEETTIELWIGGNCPSVTNTADVVLVMDHSGSMAGPKIEAAQAAALAFLDATDFGLVQVGLVGFNQNALMAQELTANKVAVARAVENLAAGGGTDIAAGVSEARAELVGPRSRGAATPVIVLLTDGHNNASREPAQRAAEQAKLEGARIFTIGYGEGADRVLLESMASAPADYYFAPGPEDLESIYRQIATRIAADVLFATLTVIDILPDNMDYAAGSGVPSPVVNGRTLTWQLADVPLGGYSITYRVLPLETGTWPTNVSAVAEGTDGLGQRGRIDFPVPEVVVVDPTPSSTPTPSPSATPTPPPTPVRPPQPVYLPLVYNECVRRQHADVVLVIDTSNSMLEPTRAGRPKLEAAVDAARAFVGLLDFGADSGAVVAFNRTAEIMTELTDSESRLLHALGDLPQAPGTRIDLGLAAAAAVLDGPGRTRANLPVVVLLTDGRPTLSTPDEVVLEAARLRDNGARIYAIGLGPDVDPELLRRVAGHPDRVVLTPDAEELVRIYSEIVRDLPCS